MSTKRKKSQETFSFDMIRQPKATGSVKVNNVTGDDAEEESKRRLRMIAYMGLQKIHLKVGNADDFYSLQLRLMVTERMTQVVEKVYDGLTAEDNAEFAAIAEEGIEALNNIARRINRGETTELYATQEESKAMELALNMGDELEDLLLDLHGKLVMYRLYRDTKDHLIKGAP